MARKVGGKERLQAQEAAGVVRGQVCPHRRMVARVEAGNV